MSNKKPFNSINSCIVCNKLVSVNGEESDDDILDSMWGTGSDTTGLTQNVSVIHEFLEQKCETENDTDDDICDMDVSDDFQDLHADTLSSETTVQSNTSLSKTTHENFKRGAEKHTSPFSLNSYLKGEFSIRNKSCCDVRSIPEIGTEDKPKAKFVKIRYTLPKWSVLCICLKCIKEDEILNLFTFPNGHRLIPNLCVDVTQNDFQNNPLLWEAFMKYADCNNRSAGTANLKNQLLDSQTTQIQSVSPTTPLFIHTKSNEHNINDCKLTELNLNVGEISCKTEQKNHQTNNVFVCPETEQSALTTQQNENIKIILPDGSYKRISLETIKKKEESVDFIKFLDTTLLDSKLKVTFEDLKKYKALRSLFTDFISSAEPNEADKLKIEVLEETHDPSLYDKSALEKNNRKNNSNQDYGECSITANTKSVVPNILDSNLLDNKNELSTPVDIPDNDSMLNPVPCTTQLNIPVKKQNSTFKFTLLDGSFKRVPVSVVEANEQLCEFTNYHATSKVFNFTVTEKHLEKYSALKQMFSDFF